MSQRNIKSFFSVSSSNQLANTSSDDSDFENYSQDIIPNADIKYYENLFKQKENLKNVATVHVNETGISECWKYFGPLYIKQKKVLHKYNFCKKCFESDGVLKP